MECKLFFFHLNLEFVFITKFPIKGTFHENITHNKMVKEFMIADQTIILPFYLGGTSAT